MLIFTPASFDRPPNFLLVDYYNRGQPYEGSVFEVAARANNVTYNSNGCCGTNQRINTAVGRIVPGVSCVALICAVLFGLVLF